MGQQVAHARALPPGTEVRKLASACRSNKTCLTNVLCAGVWPVSTMKLQSPENKQIRRGEEVEEPM